MMSRRRALLINLAVNSSPKPYDIQIINSLLMHQASNTLGYTTWYVGDEFEVDTTNNLITLTDGSFYPLRYAEDMSFRIRFAGNYCIPNAISGDTMYYFPPDSTALYEYDEATGLYTITAQGKIQVFTPKSSS